MPISNVNSAWKNDLYPLVQRTFEYQNEQFQNILNQIVSEEDQVSADFRMEGIGGYGELPDYDGELKTMNQKRGFITIIAPKEKAGAVDISYSAAKKDKLGEIKKAGTKAARSTSMTVYLSILRMFGNAFNPSVLGADGQPWASASHPNASKGDSGATSVIDPDSGTYSNLFTDPLSVNAITKIQTAANRLFTPDGLPLSVDLSDKNGLLLVSPELEPKAKELCGPNSKLIPEKLPESAENGANPIYGLSYLVVGGGRDGFGPKQWAIADRSLLAEVAKVYYVTRPTVMHASLDNPLIDRYVPYVEFGVGFGDSRCIFFSNPN